jgi:hypothetical protein
MTYLRLVDKSFISLFLALFQNPTNQNKLFQASFFDERIKEEYITKTIMIPKKALKEFKELYKKQFQIELSDEEVYRKASKILDLYETLYGQKYKNNYKIKINKT